MSYIISIVIPTYNRLSTLKKTLSSMEFLAQEKDVELLVIDNQSDDGTWEWLLKQSDKTNLRIERTPINLGIEGNIIQSLLASKGKYVWLLSDHMRMNLFSVKNFLKKLRGGLDFTFGYARIAEYISVLPEAYKPIPLREMRPGYFGKFAFVVGNISGFIVNRDCLEKAGRALFRFSSFSYPHLGVFIHANEKDTFIETEMVTKFMDRANEPRRLSYDPFRSRFIGFVEAMKSITRLNPKLKWTVKDLNIRLLLGALVYDSIAVLCSENQPIGFAEFFYCLRHYPGMIRAFLLVCTLLSLLPKVFRTAISRLFFRTFLPNAYHKAMKIHEAQFATSDLLE